MGGVGYLGRRGWIGGSPGRGALLGICVELVGCDACDCCLGGDAGGGGCWFGCCGDVNSCERSPALDGVEGEPPRVGGVEWGRVGAGWGVCV